VDVGNSVRMAIDDYVRGELDGAMLHACMAVDGTAAKLHPTVRVGARFRRLLRENYVSIVEPMVPGINLEETVFPVQIPNATGRGRQPDFADIVYVIHRCTRPRCAPARRLRANARHPDRT
jgi:hypothetical protein